MTIRQAMLTVARDNALDAIENELEALDSEGQRYDLLAALIEDLETKRGEIESARELRRITRRVNAKQRRLDANTPAIFGIKDAP